MKQDYYQILQIDILAEQEVVEAAFKRLARKYHPDQNKAADATARTQVLIEAYSILRDPAKRAQYDRTRADNRSNRAQSQPTDEKERADTQARKDTEYSRQKSEKERQEKERIYKETIDAERERIRQEKAQEQDRLRKQRATEEKERLKKQADEERIREAEMKKKRFYWLFAFGAVFLIFLLVFIIGSGKNSGNTYQPTQQVNGLARNDSVPSTRQRTPVAKTVKLRSTLQQLDTHIQVERGQSISISASGRVNVSSQPKDGAFKWVGPDGWGTDASFNQGRRGPLPRGESFAALCIRIGSGTLPIDDGRWIFVGSNRQIVATESGTVHLAVNDILDPTGQSDWWSDNQGDFTVEIRVQ